MCGIGGIVSRKSLDFKKLASGFMDVIGHRGPDESGVFFGKDMCLTHNRLSIIDLTHGKQPIYSHDKRYIIVYNGEIYNFKNLREKLSKKGIKFETNTDTEVIVNAYAENGLECLNDFNGAFAFAIWDTKEETLFAARDRMGIRPFYYYNGAEGFFFSSGLRPLLTLPFLKKKIDHTALSEYFQRLYISAPRTIIEGIRKLEPGSFLVYSRKKKKIDVGKHWDLKGRMKDANYHRIENEDACIKTLRSLLGDAVEKRLISDVDLGVFLSGGVDSSIIAALANRISGERIKTFSIGFKGMGYYDESPYAEEVAKLLKTDHRTIHVNPQIEDDLIDIVRHLEEPFGDSSCVPTYYLSRETKKFVKVALSGSGADDLFAGYRRYLISNQWLKILDNVPQVARRFLNSTLDNFSSSRSTKIGEKVLLAKKFLNISGLSDFEKHSSLMTFFDSEKRLKLFRDQVSNREIRHEELWGTGDDYVNNALYFDMLTYLPGDLLPKEDLMGMAFGLENRVPFLDHRIVDFSLKVPTKYKVKKHTTKYLLRKAFEDTLPHRVLYREKHGFALPISEWIRKDLYKFVSRILFSDRTHERAIVNSDYLKELLEVHRVGKSDLGQHLWSILIFELWCREFLD